MVCRLDVEGRCVEVARELCTRLGYAPHQLIGGRFADLVHAEDVAACEALAQVARRRRHSGVRAEVRLQGKDGRTLPVMADWASERAEDGSERLALRLDEHAGEAPAHEARTVRLNTFRRGMLDLVHEALTTTRVEAFHQHLVEWAVDVIPGAQAGALAMQESESDGYRFVATVGYDLERLRAVHLPPEAAGFGHPPGDRVPTVRSRPEGTAGPGVRAFELELAARRGRTERIVSALVVPVVVEGRTLAFLTLDNFEREDAFDDAAIEMGGIFGGYAATLMQRFELEAELQRLAYRDALTGLPNRASFVQRLEERTEAAETAPWSLLFVDLDDLKPINDSLGHHVGDAVLRTLAGRLRTHGEGHDMARLGGDEFALILDGPERDASTFAKRLLRALQRPVSTHGHALHLSASIGVSHHPRHGRSATDLLRRADVAMYYAKTQGGKNAVATFEPDMEAAPLERVLLEEALRAALERGEFVLRFQPRVDLRTGRVQSVEALVRWDHPERGLVPPTMFLPLAEGTSLIQPLCHFVLSAAARQARRWRDGGHPELRVAVNLSLKQLERDAFVDEVEEILEAEGLPADALEFEVLESVAMSDVRANTDRLSALKGLGTRIALDDFGMGSNSLAYLRDLPVDTLKVDKAFVTDVAGEAVNRAIVDAIVSLGQAFELTVVAEGIETRAQWDALMKVPGVDAAQGFLLAVPQPADAIDPLLDPGALLPDGPARP